jgi:hypothetical protein
MKQTFIFSILMTFAFSVGAQKPSTLSDLPTHHPSSLGGFTVFGDQIVDITAYLQQCNGQGERLTFSEGTKNISPNSGLVFRMTKTDRREYRSVKTVLKKRDKNNIIVEEHHDSKQDKSLSSARIKAFCQKPATYLSTVIENAHDGYVHVLSPITCKSSPVVMFNTVQARHFITLNSDSGAKNVAFNFSEVVDGTANGFIMALAKNMGVKGYVIDKGIYNFMPHHIEKGIAEGLLVKSTDLFDVTLACRI